MLINKMGNIISWLNNNNNKIEYKKKEIVDYKYVEDEKLILVIFEDESIYPVLEGVNEDGSIRFRFESSDEKGVSRFANHPHIRIPIIGWEKEDDIYTDFYFSLNPLNGELNKHFRSY